MRERISRDATDAVDRDLPYNNAVVSGMPYIRLKFCTAAPEAPLIRLSIALMTTTRPRTTAGRDVAEVRAGDVLRGRQAGDHADERLVGVELAVESIAGLSVEFAGRDGVAGRQDAAVHRDEVRREDHLDAACRRRR